LGEVIINHKTSGKEKKIPILIWKNGCNPGKQVAQSTRLSAEVSKRKCVCMSKLAEQCSLLSDYS
jgi:hypothetical protein